MLITSVYKKMTYAWKSLLNVDLGHDGEALGTKVKHIIVSIIEGSKTIYDSIKAF